MLEKYFEMKSFKILFVLIISALTAVAQGDRPDGGVNSIGGAANPRALLGVTGSPFTYDQSTGKFGKDSTLATSISLARLANRSVLQTGERLRLTDQGAEGEIVVSVDQLTSADGGIRMADASGRIWERTDQSHPLSTWWTANGVTFTNALKKAAAISNEIRVPKGNWTLTDSIHTGTLLDIYIDGTITQQSSDAAKTMFIVDQTGVRFNGSRRGRLMGALGDGSGAYTNSKAGIFSTYDNLSVIGLFIEKQTGVNTANAGGLVMIDDTLHASEMAVHAWANVGVTRTSVFIDKCYAYIASRTAGWDNDIRGFRTTNIKNVIVQNSFSFGFQLSIEFWSSTTTPIEGIGYSTRNTCINNTVDNYISMVSGVTTVNFNKLDYALRPSNAAPVPTNSTLPVAIEIGGGSGLTCIGNSIKHFPGTGIFATVPGSTYNGFPYASVRSQIMANEIDSSGRSDHAEMPAITVGCGENVEVAGNIIKDGNSSGIAIVGINGLPQLLKNIDVHDNQIINVYYHGIYTGNCTDVKIHDNTVDSSVVGDGIHTGLQPDFNIDVRNNTKTTRCVNGIFIDQTYGNSYCWYNVTMGNRTRDIRSFNLTGLACSFKGNTINPGSFAPERGTFEQGTWYEVQSLTAPFWVTTVSGTMGTIPTMTATTVSGSQRVVVNVKSPYIQPGQYVDITGNTATLKIISISADSTVWTVTGTVNASLSGAAVAWHPATFVQQFTFTAGDQTITGNKTFSGRTVTAKLISGDSIVSNGGPVVVSGDLRSTAGRLIVPSMTAFNSTTSGGFDILWMQLNNGLIQHQDSTYFATHSPVFQHDTTVAANYTATLDDRHIHVNATSSPVQVTAPAYSTMSKTGPTDFKKYVASFVVSRNDGSANAVTVVAQGANKFILAGDSLTSVPIPPGEVWTFTATGTSTTGYFKIGVQGNGKGSATVIAHQDITTGTAATITSNRGTTWVNFNPASPISAYTLTFPAAPIDGDIIQVTAGGTLTSGTVVTTLTISSTKGLLQNASTTGVNVGGRYIWQYNISTDKWHNLNF